MQISGRREILENENFTFIRWNISQNIDQTNTNTTNTRISIVIIHNISNSHSYANNTPNTNNAATTRNQIIR